MENATDFDYFVRHAVDGDIRHRRKDQFAPSGDPSAIPAKPREVFETLASGVDGVSHSMFSLGMVHPDTLADTFRVICSERGPA
jgi:hypothetical protein